MQDSKQLLDRAEACADAMMAADAASQSLGIVVKILRPGESEARMSVRPDMVNGHDTCHGGLIFSLADSAFAFACNSYNEVAVAASASIEFLRPAKLGDELIATARETHRGRKSGLYDVEVVDQNGRLVALFRGRAARLGTPLVPGLP